MITFIKKKTYLCYKALACGTGLSLGYQMTVYYDLIEELITEPPLPSAMMIYGTCCHYNVKAFSTNTALN